LEPGERLTNLTDHLPTGTLDTRWLPHSAEQRWVVITADKAIADVAYEREALTTAGAVLFYVGQAPHRELVLTLKAALPSIRKALATQAPAILASIERNTGRVRVRMSDGERLAKPREIKPPRPGAGP
jgi:hypothetical protein